MLKVESVQNTISILMIYFQMNYEFLGAVQIAAAFYYLAGCRFKLVHVGRVDKRQVKKWVFFYHNND